MVIGLSDKPPLKTLDCLTAQPQRILDGGVETLGLIMC